MKRHRYPAECPVALLDGVPVVISPCVHPHSGLGFVPNGDLCPVGYVEVNGAAFFGYKWSNFTPLTTAARDVITHAREWMVL